MYYEEKDKLKNKLKAIDGVCFTCDIWTSNQTKLYIAFRAYYVYLEWKLHKKIINYCHFPPPHIGSTMTSIVTEFMIDYGLEDKFFT